MKRFTEEHEWVELNNGTAVIGITTHAANELGDITFVELPDVGADYAQGDVVATVESVKAAADIFSPVSGTVSAVNDGLEDAPEVVNKSPEEAGWIVKLENAREEDLKRLMTEEEYEEFIEGNA